MTKTLKDMGYIDKELVIVSNGGNTVVYQEGKKLKGVVDVKFTHNLNEIAVLEIKQYVIENSK